MGSYLVSFRKVTLIHYVLVYDVLYKAWHNICYVNKTLCDPKTRVLAGARSLEARHQFDSGHKVHSRRVCERTCPPHPARWRPSARRRWSNASLWGVLLPRKSQWNSGKLPRRKHVIKTNMSRGANVMWFVVILDSVLYC